MKGKDLKRIVEESGFKIEDIVEKTGIPERTLYNQFDKDTVPMKYLRRLKFAGIELPKVAEVPSMSAAVPYYDVDASAGNVTIFNEDRTEYVRQYIAVPAFSDCDMYINVSGNSMYPKYCSGELVALKKIHDLEVVPYNEAYLIVTKEQRLLKYIRRGNSDESWLLCSENEEYQAFEVPKRKVLHLYIVKGKIAKNII